MRSKEGETDKEIHAILFSQEDAPTTDMSSLC